MECNKDEATRAKEIAEKKFLAKDIMAAKKFALKAQALFPGLEGIPQMISTLDVYISAENKITGEADWYGILGVDQQADDETVRKQYRKLALMLHPDKNKSIGADGAFKLISQAWTLLSDKAKRVAYDRKRNAQVNQKVSNAAGGSSATPGMNSTKSTKSSTRPPKSTTRAGHSSTSASSHKPKPSTFWTVCHRCKMQYEYLRVYLNHNLLCPNCHEPFFAVETAPPPSNGSKSSGPWNFSKQRQNSNNQKANKNASNPARSSAASPNPGAGGLNGPDTCNQNNFQWGPFSRTGGASDAAQAATVVQQAYEKVKREREEAQAATKREDSLPKKHHPKKMSGASSVGHPAKRRKGVEDASKQVNSETVRVNGVTKPTSTRDVHQLEIQNSLMEKARKEILKQLEIQNSLMEKARREILKKLNVWSSANVGKPATYKEENQDGEANEKEEKALRNSDMRHDESNSMEPVSTNIGECDGERSGTSGANLKAETVEIMSINVQDPDFHDFDKDRTERSFGENQVWAAYDVDDGMPRYYALIHSVISSNPFKMRISWLNSKTNGELGPLNWIASGFSKTWGDFRVGKYEINDSLNSFSHKVRWSKSPRGAISIYPRKGEVWALYRNWSPDWNELTAGEVIHKYDMVEVLEDYIEELGVTVIPLVKVAGFTTVFHQHLDPAEVRRIPREEMFRFSHHVPSCLLTGHEAPNSPKGCRELDPAATPLDLLQVITEVKEEDIMDTDEKVKEDNVVGDVKKADDNGEVGRVKGCFKDIEVINIEETQEIE
ncbi:DnaJ domain containing protein [Parasponia andersonii]|uniref:DnaJ domain containing protein n=1 Tax=Parasponia andersonii TaxID=3476 RepID=A0A2P5CIX5_PARAD|nr:DnaJ domain containing protein [Parasponia andersonii]